MLVLLLACTLGAERVHAQAPTFQFTVTPPDGTVVLVGSTNLLLTTIQNLDLFTNVTVTGTFGPLANLVFLDDGNPPDPAAGDGAFAYALTPTAVMLGTQQLTVVLRGEDASIIPDPDPTNIVEVWATNVVNYVVVAPPANDAFTNAIKLPRTPGWFAGQNRDASIEPEEPFHAQNPEVGRSVWWTWSPTVSTNVLIDLAGTTFNAILAVYRGTNLATLQEVASAVREGSSGLQPWVRFEAEAGATYRLAVAGASEIETGSIQGRIVLGGQPDRSAPQVVIEAPADGALFAEAPITVSGQARDDAPDDTGLAGVQVYLNEALVATVSNAVWSVDLTLSPGTNQISAVAVDVAGNRSVPAEVRVVFRDPFNDHFAEAFLLPGLAGRTNAVNGGATKEAGEPRHGEDEGGRSIWYWWRAPSHGTFELTTEGSDFDTLLGLYTGEEVDALATVAQNDEARAGVAFSAITASVLSNVVYRIAVDGYAGAQGAVALAYDFTPAPDLTIYYNLSVGNPPGGNILPAAGLYASNAVLQIRALPEPNFEFVRWTGGVSGSENPQTITLTGNLSVSAVFRMTNLTETLEAGRFVALSPEMGGTAGWFVSTNANSGRYGVRSGLIGNGGTSVMVIQTNMLAGTAGFAYALSSEEDWDSLEFYLNGARLGRWSGELDWRRFEFRVPAGYNRLEWRYTKDANYGDGLDAAFLDDFYLPLGAALPPPEISLSRRPDGQVDLSWLAWPDRDHVTAASENLLDWVPLFTNRVPSGVIRVTDTNAPWMPQRFYRVTIP